MMINTAQSVEEPCSVEWRTLTRMPLKARLYAQETYFREALTDAEEQLGDSLPDVLWRATLVILKADGLMAGKLGIVHRFVEAHDFGVVAVHPFTFDRLLGRELWRYQLTLASIDRLAVNDWVLTVGPALMLLLRSGDGYDLPGTVRLSSLKGAADLTVQDPDSLRSYLGQPNRLVNFIHCADEPADLVRELGLLVDDVERRRLLAALRTGRIDAHDRSILEDALKRDAAGGRSVAADEALARLAGAVAARPGPGTGRVLTDVERMRRGEKIEWRPFVRDLVALDVALDPWDVAIVGSTFIEYDVPGGSKILTNPTVESWRHGAAPTEALRTTAR